MKLLAAVLAGLILSCPAVAKEPERPHITGIAGVRIHVSNLEAARAFYGEFLETVRPCVWCGNINSPFGSVYFAYNDQFVIVDSAPSADATDLLQEIDFFTDSVPALRRYLVSKHVVVSPALKDEPDDHLVTHDPEGHQITFVSRRPKARTRETDGPVMKIIHAGFIVRDREAEDKFYKDILGFHVYWHGGMKDDVTDWLDMQVPDGGDWIEYMLNVLPTADQHLRGVMNHFALGVPDIEAAAYRIHKNGMKLTEEPKIGRDGKWQLNVYDPDDTRIEFMEFTPVEKPCCSEFTGPHPKP